MTAVGASRWLVPAILAGAAAVGLLGGAMVAKRPEFALLVGLALAGVLALAALGTRAFPWAVVLFAIVPWYPFLTPSAEPPLVSQDVLCLAIVATPLIPWAWNAIAGRGDARGGIRILTFVAVLYGAYAFVIYQTLGGFWPMVHSSIVGLLFGGVAFICARRADHRSWLAACFFGFLVLAGLGLASYAAAPDIRVGYFVGYPITYGALVIGLLPAAVIYAADRSRWLAAFVGLLGAVMLILSESSSAWVAAVAVLLLGMTALIRLGGRRAVGGIAVAALAAAAMVVATDPLGDAVERQISPDVAESSSVTHRVWSVGYATGEIGERPLFGFGAPGYSGSSAEEETGIGAIDNGYLSVAVDLGLFGLAGVLLPIIVALIMFGRVVRRIVDDPLDLALSLGIIGVGVVTFFYDSFYWASLAILIGAMGGTLFARLLSPERGEVDARAG